MDAVEARARISRLTAADREPTLDSDDLDQLVAGARRPDEDGNLPDFYEAWTANMALAVGDFVIPSTRNSHVYEVIASDGAAGATEPEWPTDEGDTVTLDGVTYTEAGSAPYVETWDFNAAAAVGWGIKAGKVAGDFDYSDDAGSYSRQQVFEMCKRQEETFRKKVSGWMPLSPNVPSST